MIGRYGKSRLEDTWHGYNYDIGFRTFEYTAGQEKDIINENPEVARELHRMLVRFMTENNLTPEMRDPRLELKL